MGYSYKPVRFDDLNAINVINQVPDLTTSVKEIGRALAKNLPEGLILIDGFLTAKFSTLIEQISRAKPGLIAIDVSDLHRSPEEIQALFSPYLPDDRAIDPELIYGKLFDGDFHSLFERKKVSAFLNGLVGGQTVILYGLGSACELFRPFSQAILYIDVTPKDTALRVYDGLYRCIGSPNEQNPDAVIRQTYFIDIELAVRLRKELIRENHIDFYLLDSELSFSMLGNNA